LRLYSACMALSCILDILNVNSGAVTAVATVILAIITGYYAYESYQIRVGSKKPFLSFQSSYSHSNPTESLYLCNFGPVARNLSIATTTTTNNKPSKIFLYSLGLGERIEILGDWRGIYNAKGKIDIKIKFHDVDMKQYSENIPLDFNLISSQGSIFVPVSPFSVDLMKISTDTGKINTNLQNINNTLKENKSKK